mgnify:CR=1 FL=1
MTTLCKRCHTPHSNPHSAYCRPCAQLVLIAFGTAYTLRTNVKGAPDRPIRKHESPSKATQSLVGDNDISI